jgi:hypothetical protein
MADEKCDVVYGVQQERRGGIWERWSGNLFYRLLRGLTGLPLPSNAITARLMSKRYVEALLQHTEREVFIDGLWHITGFDQRANLITKRRLRGTTYTFSRKMAHLVNSVTSFSNAPLIGIFYLGVAVSALAGGYTAFLVIQWLFYEKPPDGWDLGDGVDVAHRRPGDLLHRRRRHLPVEDLLREQAASPSRSCARCMDDTPTSFLAAVGDYFSAKLADHGETARGVDWNGPERQAVLFEQATKVIQQPGGFSVNDLGCGYGALLDYLRARYADVRYTGYDVCADMVAAGRARYAGVPNARLHRRQRAARALPTTGSPADLQRAPGLRRRPLARAHRSDARCHGPHQPAGLRVQRAHRLFRRRQGCAITFTMPIPARSSTGASAVIRATSRCCTTTASTSSRSW